MVTLSVSPAQVLVFLAIFLRLGLILFLLPIFRSAQVANQVKVLAVVALTIMVYPFAREAVEPPSTEPGPFMLFVLSEFMLAVLLALCLQLVFAGFNVAGQLITFQTGLGFAQVADPQGGAQQLLFSLWLQLLATLIFFGIDAHHVVIVAVVESFRTVPVGEFLLASSHYDQILHLSASLFVVAIRIASPVMVVLLMTQMGFGLIGKFSPQVNVLMLSFPVTITMGVLFAMFSVPLWREAIEEYLRLFLQLFHHLLQ